MTEPETIAAERLAKLREAVNGLEQEYDATSQIRRENMVLVAAREYIEALDQPAPESNKCAPTLMGEWRHSQGMLFCGTLRIAKTDFDTSPSPSFADRLLTEICDTMNRAR